MGVFRYPGGKTRLMNPIKEYLYPILDRTDWYVEPFVGGGSVLMQVAKDYPNKLLFINDKDERMAAFWSMVAHGNAEEIERLEELIRTPPTVELFKELRERGIPMDTVGRAYHAIFFNRCTFSGIATSGPIGGYEQKSKYAVDCRYNIERIISDFKKLRDLMDGRLTVESRDCMDYLARFENESCGIYLDPPYFVKGSGLYPVHMQDIEHQNLANYMIGQKDWLMSYDICDPIDAMYGVCERIPLDARYSINGEQRKDWVPKKEYLIRPNEEA